MRRLWYLCLLFPFLVLTAGAKEAERHTALIIDSGPVEQNTQLLLDGLYDRGIHATFLLKGSTVSQSPELLNRILSEGHEVGCRGFTGENMTFMSRRAIAREIMDFEALLPQAYPLRLFCPPGGLSDGVRQVAEVRRLGIVSWSAEADTPVPEILDGDIILLRDNTRLAVENALALTDQLLDENFRLVTVSQLAKLRQVPIRPGQIYRSFPKSEITE